MKKSLLALAAASAMILPAAPAAADPPHWAPAYGQRDRYDDRYDRRERRDTATTAAIIAKIAATTGANIASARATMIVAAITNRAA